MPEILHLGQKHQTGKDGIGKGSAIRRGSNKKLYDANYDAVFGKKGTDADVRTRCGGVSTDGL
jgi:hypothetical protein